MHRTRRLSAGAAGLALALAILSSEHAAAAEPPAACLAESFPTNRLRCLSAAAEAVGPVRVHERGFHI